MPPWSRSKKDGLNRCEGREDVKRYKEERRTSSKTPTNPTIIAEEQVKKKMRYLQRNEIAKLEVQTMATRNENFYITTQQPQPPFFSFAGGGSCAVTTGGLHFGVKPAGGGSCTLGIGLYPVLGCVESGLLGDESGQVLFSSVSGFSDFSCGCSSFDGSSVFSLLSLLLSLLFEGGASVAIANGANSRS